ncbi:MAG: calcium/sodium antiporter [Bdellovibrionota bacterium]
MFEEYLHEVATLASWPILIITLAASIAILGKSADALVDIAVELSLRWGIPSLIVGATIVSLGTTFPEVIVSVISAIQGKPGLAMGNAVGSIICDTGLIMGIACLIRQIPIDRKIVNRQGWVQLFAAVLLIIVCIPVENPASAFTAGGVMTRNTGLFFMVLLGFYMMASLKWANENENEEQNNEEEASHSKPLSLQILIALIAIIFLGLSSQILVTSASEIALRMSISQSAIAATVVAFGTSLPELVTVISAVRKGHGQIAVGNVIGADILNVLLVAGAAASVTPQGLAVDPEFFTRYFPAMLGVLIAFRLGILFSRGKLSRWLGAVLCTIYAITLFYTR